MKRGTLNSRILSPREFLRKRRPERFSDSIEVVKPQLDRSQLEYHLSTLTSRSQENEFEAFARGVAERLICPNLFPHTGPTGGGDSKVDSETVPVADTLILGWYSGIGREAGRERWASAFSAKREWRSKVKADVAKLVATDRCYEKAFFVTNQYVRDRDRANIEDELSRKHAIDVRILDLTWLLDKVFDNQLEGLAIETLRIPKSLRPEIHKGPRDTERELRLTELEAAIQERLQTGRIIPELIADAVETAKIARELDHARTEVDGRFFRAKQLADKLGSQHERLDCAYGWARPTPWGQVLPHTSQCKTRPH